MTTTETLKITTPSDREILMTRVFDAPSSLVFDAHTKPELLKRWLGAFRGWVLVVCEIDLRVGGTYRWEWHNPDGGKMGAGGVYREVVRPERLVNTEQFDKAWYDGEAISTTLFVEQDGKTTLSVTMLYDSKAIRDAVLESGMERGLVASYDKLAELLASQEV